MHAYTQGVGNAAGEGRLELLSKEMGRTCDSSFSSSFDRSSSSVPPMYVDSASSGASPMAVPMRHPLSPNLSPENCKRPGIPPSYPNNPFSLPNSQTSPSQPVSGQISSQNFSSGHSHTRSLSQPSFFSLDSLPPLSPSPYRESSTSLPSDPVSAEVPMEDDVIHSNTGSLPSPASGIRKARISDGLPPRRGHRRSNSDIPLGFMHSSPPFIPFGISDQPLSVQESWGLDQQVQFIKQGSFWDRDGISNSEVITSGRKSETEITDDLLNAYLNLENIDKMNSSDTEDKDLNSKASGSKTNGCESSDNEVESCGNISVNGSFSRPGNGKREGLKRSASEDTATPTRHYRSLSMDSYMGSLNFDSEPHDLSNANNGNSNKFSVEIGSNEFSETEVKKIMESHKLADLASSDPKRVKRILANRQSAARSKERKMRYIVELEHKVQTLQTEATTLSAQVSRLQRDSAGLSSENNELKFRVQAFEQQGQLKDALNEALTAEVQRLKTVAAELSGEAHLSNRMAQQLSINQQSFHVPNQRTAYINLYQNSNLLPKRPNGEVSKPELKP